MTLYLHGTTLSGSFVCCNVMHYLFSNDFCNILIQLKLQSQDTVFSTVYVVILEQLLVKKSCIFCFLPPMGNSHFANHFLIAALYYEIGHPTL